MKKALHYIYKSAAIFILLILLLYIIVFTYVSLNKKKIINQVTTGLSDKLNGKVSIGNVELSFFRHFPKISVVLNDIAITDTLFPQHHHPFFQAKQVFINLSITKLVQKEPSVTGLRIQNGSFYLYTDSSGYTNTYLTHPKRNSPPPTTKSENANELKTIELDDVRLTLDDRQKEKLHDFVVNNLKIKVDDKKDMVLFDTDAAIDIKSLAFNLPKGIFLKGKSFNGRFDMQYDKKKSQLQFDSINIKLEEQPFNLSGRFDLQGTAPQFLLNVHIRKADYAVVKSLLPQRIATSLSLVDLDKPLDADAFISGPLKGGEPLVNINWQVNSTHLITPFMDFDEASFTGFYKNEVVFGLPRNDANSVISINNFTAGWQSLPVKSDHIEILNLEKPLLTCDLRSAFPLSSLNEIIQTNSLQLTSGDAAMTVTYKGPIENNNNTNSFINGNLLFKNGTVLYTPRNVEMKGVNGSLIFKNSDVLTQNFQCNVLNNKIVMNGTAKNLLTLINTAPNNIIINWNVYSPQLNLGAFTYLFKSPKKTGKTNSSIKRKYVKLSGQIDELIEKNKINLSLKADKILYKKFEANNLDANLILLQDRYLLNNVSMNLAGGRMSINGQLFNAQTNYHKVNINANLNNVDVKKIFYAFENFGQDGITSETLEGLLSSKVNASLAMNDDGKVLPNSVVGTIDFSLKNGALNNYEPIKKIQTSIFKKRDFDNIRFAELKDRLEVNKGEVKINRMEIQSSVMSLFVEGIYSRKGNTDISIQVPLNNLKKRGDDYNPENIGTEKKGGRSIFLRGRPGQDGNVKFKLDLFNKFKKDKNNTAPE